MNSLFTIVALPQEYNAGVLRFNVVFIPRNISPLNDLSAWGFPGTGPFAEAADTFKLEAKLIAGLNALPEDADVNYRELLPVAIPDTAKPIYEEMKVQFVQVDDIPSPDQEPPPVQATKFIKKYLPMGYRKSFNFTNPRTDDAVIDDSYHCAFKSQGSDPTFKQTSDRISWGKVYAHCLRHPGLAAKAGLIFTDLTITVPNSANLTDGGWLFVDFPDPAAEPHLYADVQATPGSTKRYASRIPPVGLNDSRTLFAPVLFPVAYGTPISGIYDEPLREAADYDDGFAKIVHTFQPISTNFLQEEEDENTVPPTKDAGIRLGWDDEQVLIWQNRQLKEDSSVGANQRLDAPLGVTKYYIDVRVKAEEGQPDNEWTSLNVVSPRADLTLAGVTIIAQDEDVELGTEVYPMQLTADQNTNYWLPSYFTQWSGKSMVLPDEDANTIYRIAEEERQYETGDGVMQDLKVALQRQYEAVGLEDMALLYGETYEFRVRMGDISGGGPKADDDRIFEAIAKDTSITFKRHVPPNAMRMEDLPVNGEFYTDSAIRLRRPIIEYPNVEFTGFYDDVVDKLTTYGKWTEGKGVAEQLPSGEYTQGANYPVGLPDPDVNLVEVTVEVKALKMDHKLSSSRREAYYHLYTVTREMNALDAAAEVMGAADETDPFQLIETPLELPLVFLDATVIDFESPTDFGEWPVSMAQLESDPAIVLPTARDIRITLRPLGNDDAGYSAMDSWKRGRTIQFWVRQAPKEEQDLFDPAYLTDAIEGIYLQPNPVVIRTGTQVFLGKTEDAQTRLIQRFANQVNLKSTGNSLLAHPGTRVQLGCARSIRHSLSPDGTSLTFSTQTDMINHWLVAVNLRLQRDWSWDAMNIESFLIMRTKKFGRQGASPAEEEVGAIEMQSAIDLRALTDPDRSFTQLVFIDAVEPKKDPNDPSVDNFPDIIELQYRVVPQFKTGQEPQSMAPPTELELTLPVTTIPAQEPKLASAGVALSPYVRDERYTTTEPRRKFLWLELEEPINDPNDALFVRLLAYAPDPLLADLGKYPELLEAPIEPAIALNPELIRVIRPDQVDDNAGLSAMTELEPALTDPGQQPRHFLVPLPPGLHTDSDEFFGFFTYELRVGHNKIWTTAQGRFGRPLRVTGAQHPAPTLFCTVERTTDAIKVVAPYATAVANGKNVTADPPRTELWALIYAQVKMADNQDYRNILLGERRLELRREVQVAGIRGVTVVDLQLVQSLQNSDKKQYGTTAFTIAGVRQMLKSLGLPLDSPLSVLTVEFLPTNYQSLVAEQQKALIDINNQSPDPYFVDDNLNYIPPGKAQFPYPLSRDLGQYRIMRTSPLVAVPQVCPEP